MAVDTLVPGLTGAAVPAPKGTNMTTAMAELTAQLGRLRHEIVTGTHPRLKVAPEVIRRGSVLNGTNSAAAEGKIEQSPGGIDRKIANILEKSKMQAVQQPELAPVPQTAEDKILAERKRLEATLIEQAREARNRARLQPSEHEAMPDFDVDRVLQRAQDLVKPLHVPAANNVSSDTDQTFYSSQMNDSSTSTAAPDEVARTLRLCKYVRVGRTCPFGSKCSFSHIMPAVQEPAPPQPVVDPQTTRIAELEEQVRQLKSKQKPTVVPRALTREEREAQAPTQSASKSRKPSPKAPDSDAAVQFLNARKRRRNFEPTEEIRNLVPRRNASPIVHIKEEPASPVPYANVPIVQERRLAGPEDLYDPLRGYVPTQEHARDVYMPDAQRSLLDPRRVVSSHLPDYMPRPARSASLAYGEGGQRQSSALMPPPPTRRVIMDQHGNRFVEVSPRVQTAALPAPVSADAYDPVHTYYQPGPQYTPVSRPAEIVGAGDAEPRVPLGLLSQPVHDPLQHLRFPSQYAPPRPLSTVGLAGPIQYAPDAYARQQSYPAQRTVPPSPYPTWDSRPLPAPIPNRPATLPPAPLYDPAGQRYLA